MLEPRLIIVNFICINIKNIYNYILYSTLRKSFIKHILEKNSGKILKFMKFLTNYLNKGQ